MNGPSKSTHGVWIAVSPKGVGGLSDLLAGSRTPLGQPRPALVTGVKVISAAPLCTPLTAITPAPGQASSSPPLSEGHSSEIEDGEPIKLPESLESLPKSDNFPTQRHRWNTNEEIASMLIAFDKHHEWMSKEVKIRPKSGSMLLYSRKKVRYRRDGYCWKKRKDGKTTREDHMKLKVQGMECIYGCYVHSAILPTFHRRCYWLLQNPDIVLVHYLNVPYPDDNKMLVTNSVSLWGDKKEWTKEELISQIKPMFYSEEDTDLNSELEVSTNETVETIVVQLMEKQRTARTLGHIECACPDSTCLDGKNCVHQVKQEVHNIPHPRSRSGRGGVGLGGGGGGGGGGLGAGHTRLMETPNQFFEADPRFYPERTTYSQVSSTTGNQGLLVQARERHSPGSGHSTPSRGHTPLVFSLTQLQGSGGLVVLNSNSGPTSTTSSMSPYNRIITPPVSDTPSPRPLMSSCEPPSDIGSATRGEVGSVSAAVNTLTNIHEFSLDLHNGNYDSVYSGLQPVTDSLLSGPESKKSDEDSNKSDSDGGPLLDFKTAFSDLDNKNDMSFLHETLDMTHDDIHRTLSANLPSCQQEKVRPTAQAANHMQNGHNNHSGHQMEYQDHTQQHQHHHQQQQQQQSHHNNSFDVNLDAFDILSDFPELSGYESNVGGNTNGLIHNGSQSPMLSQSAASVGGVGAANTSNHIGGSIKARTLEYRENLVSISDYSPGWAYTNGEEKVLVTGPWYSQSAVYQILFNGVGVPTTLVQSGVLRCYTPAQEKEGDVELQVACDGYIVSESVIFKYKSNPMKKPVNDGTMDNAAINPATNMNHAARSVTESESNLVNCLTNAMICNAANTNQQQSQQQQQIQQQLTIPNTSQQPLSMDFTSSKPGENSQLSEFEKLFESQVHNVSGGAKEGGLLLGVRKEDDPLVGLGKDDPKYRLLNKLEELGICSIEDMQQMYKENFSDFEDQVVTMCQNLTTAEWGKGDEGNDVVGGGAGAVGGHDSKESILHLAASLGLSRLVCSLLHWAAEHPGKQIGMEVDALALDIMGFTPLMRACHHGNKEVATILYHWNSAAANIKNKLGQTCAEVAGASSSPEFRLELERMEAIKKKETFHSLSRNNSQDTAFVKPEGRRISKAVMRAPSLEEHLTVPGTSSRSPSPGFRSVSMNVRSLRGGSPAACAASTSTNIPNQGEGNQRRFGMNKRPSVDSGINIDVQAPPRPRHQQTGSKHGRQLSKEDRSLSLPSSGFQKTLKCQENITVYKILPREKEKSVDGDRQRDSQDRYVESCVRYTGICGRQPNHQCSSLCMCNTNISSSPPCPQCQAADQSAVSSDGQENDKVLTLAEQFLAAMPDRIKLDGSSSMTSMEEDTESMDCYECCSMVGGLDCMSDDLGIESMADDQSVDFNFEEACYRYRDVGTPSLSPASYSLDSPRSSVQESPISFQFSSGDSPSTAELSEFLQAKCEKDFSNLTLNEREQRELFQAAQIIQKAFRSYKGRKQSVQEVAKPLQEVETEARAAVIIQNYYRRYKQYCYWRRVAKAAVVIQKKYRNYCEHKRFKKSEEAATCIQTYYRNYRQHQTSSSHHNPDDKESTPPNPGLKRTFSQRRQNQAARKIQQFMRKSHLKLVTARVVTVAASERPPTPGTACPPSCRGTIHPVGATTTTTGTIIIPPTTRTFSLGVGEVITPHTPTQQELIKYSSLSSEDEDTSSQPKTLKS